MANYTDREFDKGSIAGAAQASYESARETGRAMGDAASSKVDELEDRAEAYARGGQASLSEMVTKAEFAIIDHPLAAVGIAFAAGWVTGRLFR